MRHASCGGDELEGVAAAAEPCDTTCDDTLPKDCKFALWGEWTACSDKSRRAAACGRAELRALTFLEARYGAFSAKMQTAGTLPGNLRGNLRVPSGYPVHFAGA